MKLSRWRHDSEVATMCNPELQAWTFSSATEICGFIALPRRAVSVGTSVGKRRSIALSRAGQGWPARERAMSNRFIQRVPFEIGASRGGSQSGERTVPGWRLDGERMTGPGAPRPVFERRIRSYRSLSSLIRASYSALMQPRWSSDFQQSLRPFTQPRCSALSVPCWLAGVCFMTVA